MEFVQRLILNFATNRGKWSDSCFSHFTPRVRSSSIHWVSGLVDPRTGLDMMGRRKTCSTVLNLLQANKRINMVKLVSVSL